MEVEVQDAAVIAAHIAGATRFGDQQPLELAVAFGNGGRDASLAPGAPFLASSVEAELRKSVAPALPKLSHGARLAGPPCPLDQRSKISVIRAAHEHTFAYRSDRFEWAPWDSNPDLPA